LSGGLAAQAMPRGRSALAPVAAPNQRPTQHADAKRRDWSTLRNESMEAPPKAAETAHQRQPMELPIVHVQQDTDDNIAASVTDSTEESLCALLQSPTESEFLETPAPAAKKSQLKTEKAWVEAEKAKLELAKAQLEAEATALKAEMNREKAFLEAERLRLEMEKERARLASERAWVEAEKAKLEAERTRQETERMRLSAAWGTPEEAATTAEQPEAEAQGAEAAQDPNEGEAVVPKKELLRGNELMAAVKSHLAANPELGPRDLHDELLEEGHAVELGAVQKAVKKARKYERRTLGDYTPSLAEFMGKGNFFQQAGSIFSVIGWVLRGDLYR